MRIGIGSDHAGFFLKETLESLVGQMGHGVIDYGCDSPEPVHYPEVASRVAAAVARGEVDRAILICGSGIGVSVVANKVAGVRAALVHEPVSARLARAHNDANVLCLGARLIGEDMARACVEAFLAGTFEGGRHEIRLQQIAAIESLPSPR
ncbi:MAG: ribose 5-phosphate isomerase B [Candidatus Sericytochromatia bacterium]|nr:ribose 5-phosphate isomerase B [Candidatus Sericytochromatia bacterium]